MSGSSLRRRRAARQAEDLAAALRAEPYDPARGEKLFRAVGRLTGFAPAPKKPKPPKPSPSEPAELRLAEPPEEWRVLSFRYAESGKPKSYKDEHWPLIDLAREVVGLPHVGRWEGGGSSRRLPYPGGGSSNLEFFKRARAWKAVGDAHYQWLILFFEDQASGLTGHQIWEAGSFDYSGLFLTGALCVHLKAERFGDERLARLARDFVRVWFTWGALHTSDGHFRCAGARSSFPLPIGSEAVIRNQILGAEGLHELGGSRRFRVHAIGWWLFFHGVAQFADFFTIEEVKALRGFSAEGLVSPLLERLVEGIRIRAHGGDEAGHFHLLKYDGGHISHAGARGVYGYQNTCLAQVVMGSDSQWCAPAIDYSLREQQGGPPRRSWEKDWKPGTRGSVRRKDGLLVAEYPPGGRRAERLQWRYKMPSSPPLATAIFGPNGSSIEKGT